VWLKKDCEKKDNDLLCAVIAIVTSESKSEHNRHHMPNILTCKQSMHVRDASGASIWAMITLTCDTRELPMPKGTRSKMALIWSERHKACVGCSKGEVWGPRCVPINI
jgi:hypothetical protein